jgi:hypothetical protein
MSACARKSDFAIKEDGTMRVIKILLGLTLLLCAGSPAAADPFTALWIFGDSTVDTGWYITNKSGETSYDHYMQPTPPAPSLGVGKPTSSPGEMSVEVLADALGLQAIPANKTIGTNHGTNYATGGAKNVRHNAASGDGFPNAVPTVTQLKTYLANTASATALYVISSGDNDVTFALKHPGNKNYLTKAANALAKEISVLQQDGAQYIIVVGLPQWYGSTQQKRNFRATYNTKLNNKLNDLHVSFFWADANHVRFVMESYNTNPPTSSPFGIINYTIGKTNCTAMCPDSACSMPKVGTGIKTDWAYVCSTAMGAPSIATKDAASEWADDNHYATGGQKVLGTYLYCAAKNKWSNLTWGSSSIDCTTVSSLVK